MKVRLEKHGGAVKINIDGKIYEPLSFKSFRPTPKNISDFYKAGVRIFDILSSGIICLLGVPYSLYGESWVGDGRYDFDPVDKQIDMFLENAPDAYFALMLQIDTRDWYCEKYGVPNTFTHLSQEIADEKWKSAAMDYLRAIIRHTEEKYGDRFYGYFILGGMTTEWFSQNDNEESYPTKLRAYRDYLGDENAEIPDKQTREIPQERLLLDPVKEENLVKYRTFHSQLIAKTVCEFAHVVKEETNYNKLCGVYFGYLFELSGPRLWNAGSLDYERVYNCPDIDMISSPSAYPHRSYNGTSAVMVTSDTLDLRDKLYFLEFDHITHLAPAFVPDGNGIGIPGYNAKFANENQTIDVMRRDFMLCCARRIALWWFDMFEGWFYSEGMMNEVSRFVEIAKKLTETDSHSVSEVCVVAEGDSLYNVNKNSRYNNFVLDVQRDAFGRMGAPYDIYSVCDLENLDLDKYKLFVFLDQFSMTDKTKNVIDWVKSKGKTILWYGAPDVVTKDGISVSSASLMTGINLCDCQKVFHKAKAFGTEYTDGLSQQTFVADDDNAEILGEFQDGQPSLVMKRGEYISIFSSMGCLPAVVLTEILNIAGVKIYSEGLPTYVNSQIVGAYLDEGKNAVLNLDDGSYTDLFSNRRFESINGLLTVEYTNSRAVMLVKEK